MSFRRVAIWTTLLGFGLLLVASPALAGSKKKSKAEDSSEEKSDDDEEAKSEDAPAEEEPVAEPDAWERPPVEEEKAPPPPPKKVVVEKVGDGKQIEVGLMLGYGFETESVFSVDPYFLGAGLRGGYAFDFHLFLGLNFTYFLGTSDTLQQMFGGALDTAANNMFIAPEVGYDVWISDVIFRPSAWIGVALGVQDPHPLNLKRHTEVDFAFSPGASVIYVMEDLFIGGDLRIHVVTGKGSSGAALSAYGGLRF